jgi:hypothetical protein
VTALAVIGALLVLAAFAGRPAARAGSLLGRGVWAAVRLLAIAVLALLRRPKLLAALAFAALLGWLAAPLGDAFYDWLAVAAAVALLAVGYLVVSVVVGDRRYNDAIDTELEDSPAGQPTSVSARPWWEEE